MWAKEAERQEKLQAAAAMQQLLQAEAARETQQRLLGQQAAVGAVGAVGAVW